MTESWVFGANDPTLGLSLNHLPYTAFLHEPTGSRHLAIAIGGCLLDLHAAAERLPGPGGIALQQPFLNDFMALGPAAWQDVRASLQHILSRTNKDRAAVEAALLSIRGVELLLPADTRNYTDFYAARDHARRVGELFRPDEPLLPNYDSVPIAYHGRASSLVPSGTPVRRPNGQTQAAGGARFGPTERLDYELELGFFVGAGNALGEPISIAQAAGHLFGVSLLNDWSARDIQAWEYRPLGPFLGKNFCTSVSPLLTPMAALEPFRVAAPPHAVLPYLQESQPAVFNLDLTAEIIPSGSDSAQVLSRGNSRHLWWTAEQMIAHHSSGGCNLQPGDLLGSGTVSGPELLSAGCLLELTRGGAVPFSLPNGEQRTYLQDGDEIILTAQAQQPGEPPIRLGECRGTIQPARSRT